MKKTIIFGLILFLLIPIFTKADATNGEWDILENMVYDLDGQVIEADIAFNSIIGNKFLGKEEIEILGEKLIEKTGLIGEEMDPFILQDRSKNDFYSKMVIFEDDFSQINYDGWDKDGNKISINLNSYKNTDINLTETALYIGIIKDEDFSNTNDIIERIEKIYTDLNCQADITSCVMGRLEGKQEEYYILDKLHNSLESINGNIVDEFSEEEFSSFTLYSPEIENYLTINKKKININLSIRYNVDEDYTYLWIGTPIIATGY